jgi:hypothetical protein
LQSPSYTQDVTDSESEAASPEHVGIELPQTPVSDGCSARVAGPADRRASLMVSLCRPIGATFAQAASADDVLSVDLRSPSTNELSADSSTENLHAALTHMATVAIGQ